MCGILGQITLSGAPVSSEIFCKALRQLAHRGPDDSGTFYSTGPKNVRIALGHTRLSILDLSMAGHQPMMSPRTGSVITYNGEVYNFAEIRRQLVHKGYKFESACDTEVILAAYDAWGKACLKHFNGMFAFAIWDQHRQTLFLARDRVGIKPLYYYHAEKTCLSFASELTALASLHASDLRLKSDSLSDFFAFGYFPGSLTPLQNCYKLLPGHTIEYDLASGQLTLEQYWDPLKFALEPEFEDKEEVLLQRLEDILHDAIQKRLISDVSLGAFLSGGIDSSLVVSIMSKVATERIKTFSIGFTLSQMNEAPLAKKIAEYLGTEHHELYISPDKLEDTIAKVVTYYDEPFADTSCIPTSLLSQMTRSHVTVALSGDGGDELYWGYERYVRVAALERVRSLPGVLRSIVRLALKSCPSYRMQRWAWLLDSANVWESAIKQEIQPLVGLAIDWRALESSRIGERVYKALPHASSMQVSAVTDLMCFLPDDILVKLDRASMAFALEARVPFLDHRFVEFSLQVPHNLKRHRGVSKYLLRQALAKHIPRALWERPKTGFAIPLHEWFRGPLKPWLLDVLSDDWDWTEGVVTKSAVDEAIRSHMSCEANRSRLLWSFMILKSWGDRIGLI